MSTGKQKTTTERKWALDFNSLDQSKRHGGQRGIVDPIGFNTNPSRAIKGNTKQVQDNTADAHAHLKVKKAWDAALAPAKSIPMNAFMLWMSGNGVQIFSIMITFMLFFQPIKAIMGLGKAFERFEINDSRRRSDLTLPKLVFLAMHLLTILLGVYKLSAMGLLPTATSDWLAFMEPKKILEYALL